MPKRQTVFTCGQCGHQEARWLGRCPDCNAWNSFTEEVVAAPAGRRAGSRARTRRRRGRRGRHGRLPPLSPTSPRRPTTASPRASTSSTRARRRHRARLARAGRRRARHRQEHAAAAGPRRGRGRAAGASGLRRGVTGRRSRCAPSASAATATASPCWPRPNSRPITAVVETTHPALLVVDSVQTLYSDDLTRRRAASARCARRPAASCVSPRTPAAPSSSSVT